MYLYEEKKNIHYSYNTMRLYSKSNNYIVESKLTCKATAMISWGRLLRMRRFLKGCLTALAIRLASTISKYSGSTLSMPRIFLSTALPSSWCPRSIRLLGVSTTNKAPTVSRLAGTPANPRDNLQPHPPSILLFNGFINYDQQIVR